MVWPGFAWPFSYAAFSYAALPGRFHVAARAFVIGAFRRSDTASGCYHEEKAT
jgi:hypothetical protein